ncbi:MAG TPA: YncE family protein, partial [Puia sp.]|nr:YncE family protein [Puia sp.]
MKHCLLISAFACLAGYFAMAQGSSGFHVTKTFKIGSPGGWDYIASGPDHRIYVSHGTQVNILDDKTGDSVGVVPNTTGVHGIAFAGSHGFTSNGRLNTVTEFDLKTDAIVRQINTGENPDAIMYDPHTHLVITCNGRSHDLTLINASTGEVTGTIPLDGKPETAVADGEGKLFVNIEDKNKISEVDLASKTVVASWPLGADGPTGLAIDQKTKRLFAGCEEKLVVMDATNGNVVATLPIGKGCDGVGFDPGLKLVFASCGEGVLTVIKEESAGNFQVIDNVPTKRSARTCAVNESRHEVYLSEADTE